MNGGSMARARVYRHCSIYSIVVILLANILELVRIQFMIDLTKEEFTRLKQRDPEIFVRFYESYKEILYNFLLAKTKGNCDAAEELYSQVNEAIWNSIGSLSSDSNLIGWVIRIAFRKYCNYVKKIYTDKKLIKNLSVNHPGNAESDGEPDMEKKQLLLIAATQNIKEKYRKIVELKYFQGKSIKEVAVLSDMTETAVGGLLFRAKEELKKEIRNLERFL